MACFVMQSGCAPHSISVGCLYNPRWFWYARGSGVGFAEKFFPEVEC